MKWMSLDQLLFFIILYYLKDNFIGENRMIIRVSEKNIQEAAKIHSLSWKDSHKEFCSKDFIEIHDIKKQKIYLKEEINTGKELYMLIEDYPVGIISIYKNIIENLYVLPKEQHKGYGTKLLLFAVNRCEPTVILWVLNNNKKAYSLYSKYGFKKTGRINKLSNNIMEIQMFLNL